MDYRTSTEQRRRLMHECCNYDGGNCLILEDGEPCECVQRISYSLPADDIPADVLPLDETLEACPVMHRGRRKRSVCRAFFCPSPTEQKCPDAPDA